MIDPELLGYLQSMERRLQSMEGRLQSMEGRLQPMETRLYDAIQQAKEESIASSRAELKPVVDLIESLTSEVHDGFARTDARLEAVQVRLDLQGGKLRAGSLWTARLDEWSDKVDHLIAERDKQIADMQNRIAKLENPMA